MKFTGTIQEIGEEVSVVRKDGGIARRKDFIVVESSNEEYPPSIAMSVWDDRIEELAKIDRAKVCNFYYRARARSYDTSTASEPRRQFFNDLRCYRIEVL